MKEAAKNVPLRDPHELASMALTLY
jgi:hypothetical protein